MKASAAREVVPADPGPMARLESLKTDEHAVNEIFHRLTDDEPQTLAEIAKSWRVPKGKFTEWFLTEHAERYEMALKVLGAEIGHAVKRMVDEVTPETLGIVKLRTDRYLRLAGHWDPARYAPKAEDRRGGGGAPVLVIEIVGAEAARIIEGEVVTKTQGEPA